MPRWMDVLVFRVGCCVAVVVDFFGERAVRRRTMVETVGRPVDAELLKAEA